VRELRETDRGVTVRIFVTVPYPQHYYDTGCLDEESLGMNSVADYGG